MNGFGSSGFLFFSMMRRWQTKRSTYVLKHRWLTVRADRCMTAQGVWVDPYFVLEAPDWVHILALDSEHNMLIVRQYRHAAGILSAELPGGVIDPGESPVEAARRELKEETGCVAERYQKIGTFYPNPARFNNRVHTFLAFDTRIVGRQDLDETEQIEFAFVPIHRLLEMVDSGEFVQGLHIASVLMGLKKLGRFEAG